MAKTVLKTHRRNVTRREMSVVSQATALRELVEGKVISRMRRIDKFIVD